MNTDTQSKVYVYPNIMELLSPELQDRIPESLAAWIRERYETLGEKYLTDKQYVDGRYINGCMFKSSIQDALEEVVDAVFNVLVWHFKLRILDTPRPDIQASAYSALIGLIELYALLKSEQGDEAL